MVSNTSTKYSAQNMVYTIFAVWCLWCIITGLNAWCVCARSYWISATLKYFLNLNFTAHTISFRFHGFDLNTKNTHWSNSEHLHRKMYVCITTAAAAEKFTTSSRIYNILQTNWILHFSVFTYIVFVCNDKIVYVLCVMNFKGKDKTKITQREVMSNEQSSKIFGYKICVKR